MAEAITIARPYAEAAFKLARDRSRLAAWADMLQLLEAVSQDARMQARIGDPNVTAAELDASVGAVDLLSDHDRPGVPWNLWE